MPPVNIKSVFPRTVGRARNGAQPTFHTELHWHPAHPHAVRLVTAHPESGSRTAWVFARDLLDAGLHAPSGIGDVTVAPTLPGITEILLRSHVGAGYNLALRYPAAALAKFVDDTHLQVPAGSEYYAFNPAMLFGRETA